MLLGGRSLAGLVPGGSSAGATNVTIPAGTANGIYFIVARADDLNQAFESNEGNNTLLGGDGNDWIDGGAGHDILYGQNGTDTIADLSSAVGCPGRRACRSSRSAS